MKNFIEKVNEIERIREEVDDHVWTVFFRYIEITKELFSDPNTWSTDEEGIHFDGYDGCMGSYDSKSLFIPNKFFVDPEKELIILAERLKTEKEIREKHKDDKDRKIYEKLKAKFEK